MDYRPLYEYYWLRPENALWRSRDFQVMEDISFDGPSLDFGAGDGAVSFLRAGGQLALSYDAFSETLDTSRFYLGDDIYDQFNDLSEDVVAIPATYQIDVGFDKKENLLAKARKLNLYRKTVAGDGNERLPFRDNEFRTIFSNIVYWCNDPHAVMSELARITMPGGRLILFLPSNRLANYSFYNEYYLGKGRPVETRFLEMLDMGRLARNIKVSKSADGWESIFRDTGLDVIIRRNHISGALVRLWDIGLRPFSPFMIQMANRLNGADRAKAKKRWVDETYDLFKGFLDLQPALEKEEETAFFLFVLQKS
jgi:SAM-dependent methyltransferase